MRQHQFAILISTIWLAASLVADHPFDRGICLVAGVAWLVPWDHVAAWLDRLTRRDHA